MDNINNIPTEKTIAQSFANASSLEDFLRAMDKLADVTGTARKSKGMTAKGACRAAARGAISPDDAKAIYERYTEREGRKAEGSYSKSGFAVKSNELKQIIRLGHEATMFDPVALLDDVDDVLKELTTLEVKVKDAFKSYLAVARAQLGRMDSKLSGADIRELVKIDAKEASLIDDLIAQYKKAVSISETHGFDMTPVTTSLADKINEAGGEVPKSKEEIAKEREIAAAEKKALKALELVAQLKTAA